jgi:hypothetical protein
MLVGGTRRQVDGRHKKAAMSSANLEVAVESELFRQCASRARDLRSM